MILGDRPPQRGAVRRHDSAGDRLDAIRCTSLVRCGESGTWQGSRVLPQIATVSAAIGLLAFIFEELVWYQS
jgi:hypothetical protein